MHFFQKECEELKNDNSNLKIERQELRKKIVKFQYEINVLKIDLGRTEDENKKLQNKIHKMERVFSQVLSKLELLHSSQIHSLKIVENGIEHPLQYNFKDSEKHYTIDY